MMHSSFERSLQTVRIELDFLLPNLFPQELCKFYLNPRYLRGSDFLMRFSQGRWAEDIVVRAIDGTDDWRAVPYGPSSVAPSDPYEMERYFERLDRASLVGKRPDLLILPKDDYDAIGPQLDEIGRNNLPFVPEEELEFLYSKAIVAVEVEDSLWVAHKMPDYDKGIPLMELISRRRRFRNPERARRWETWKENVARFVARSEKHKDLKGFLEGAKVPTLIVKEEDIEPLKRWETTFGVPIFVFHLFYDEAYYIPFRYACELIESGVVPPTEQTFYAPGGPTTRKVIYKLWYTLAKPLGRMIQAPEMSAKFIEDRNGHILPYVHFSGGSLELSAEVIDELRKRTR